MIEASARPPAKERQLGPWRIGCGIVGLLLALFLVWMAISAVRVVTAGRGALSDLRALQATDLSAMASVDPAELRQMRDRFASLEGHLATVGGQADPWLPLARRLDWLPGAGPEIAAAPELLQIAGGMATAGRAVLDGALPVVEALKAGSDGSVTARVLPPLIAAGPQWQEAAAALDAVMEARADLDVSGLDPRLAEPLALIDRYAPLLATATNLAGLAPEFLGAEQPRTYLLLAQNSDELRPTGGFISGVGEITLDRGEITKLAFRDGSSIYNKEVDHPPAPPALERYMLGDILLFRDANWSPDYPTSAAVAQALYLLDTGTATDGVIAFDVEAVRRVVAAIGPLSLPGYEEMVTEQNLITAMRAVWEQPFRTDSTLTDRATGPWSAHRKDFMGDLAAATRLRLEGGDVDLAALASAIRSSLEEKHLLMVLNSGEANALLTNANWNGVMAPGGGDYLLVIDSNVGWNKVNANIDRTTTYQVRPAADGSAQATLELHYQHKGTPQQGPCEHTGRYGDSYTDMLNRCYFDYVRVYAPAGATLRSVEGFEPDTLETLPGERGTTLFAGFLIVPSGDARQVRLQYDLPAQVANDGSYRLRIQKQPGTPPWPLRITLVDPAASWTAVSPPGQRTELGIEYSLSQRADVEITAIAAP